MSLIEESKHLRIPFHDIKEATQNFTTRIGRGGYGPVYKGQLSLSGELTVVAVKRLQIDNLSGQGVKEFLTEIQLLSRYKHPNLVSLVGFCEELNEKFLVYEYAEHGSLDNYLNPIKTRGSLTWKQRINICIDAARGLDHLHNHVAQNHRIIHRDIKSANILLDHNWKAMIADFGLSKIGRAHENDSYLITNASGTHGYCDPAYIHTGILTKESDIYSFGVVLFEVLCGRLCFINVNSKERFLAPLAQHYYKEGKLNLIIDSDLKNHMNSDSMRVFSEIAFKCLQDDRRQRPSMGLVLQSLEEALELLEMEETPELQELDEALEALELKVRTTYPKNNPIVTKIPGNNRTRPLYMAALSAKPDMVRHLYGIFKKMGGDFWEHDNRGWFLLKCVEANIFDVALQILNDRPELLVKKGLLTDVLLALAQKTHAFKGIKPHIVFRIIKSFFAVFHVKAGPGEKETEALQLLRRILENIATMPKSKIDDIMQGPCVTQTVQGGHAIKVYPSRVLFLAAKVGNTRFIVEIIRSYPDLIWKQDDKGKTIFHLAIKCRQAKIYNLLHEIGAMKDLVTLIEDKKGNNMLHMVAKGAKQKRFQNVFGAALQMQRELLWFKEVEQMIPSPYRQRENGVGETPQDLFTKKHAALVIKGEDWMKNTASQCMVVAALIATVVFAAAFTLPGGYNQGTGIPFFRKEPALIIFTILDAVSLISSSTSILMFLAILTSRYAERDFLESLPKKLLFGLATLFLSIVTMMVAFSVSFFVLYNKKLEWVPITIACLASMLPIVLFVILQSRLLGDVFHSTYQSRYLFKPKKRILHF